MSRPPVRTLITAMAAAATLVASVPGSPAHAQPEATDFTAAHQLTVEFFGSAHDDWDFGDGFDFDPPPVVVCCADRGQVPTSPWRLTTILDLASGADVHGPLHDPDSLRRAWWRGPFRDSQGVGVLPTDDDVALCFKDQAAWYFVQPGNEIRVTTRIGLFVGKPHCDTGKYKADAEISVAAKVGQRACGSVVTLERSGDWVKGSLCLTNHRIEPRPVASVTPGNTGQAPKTVILNGSPSIVTGGVTSWRWQFGDGHTSPTGPGVAHTYTNPGTYVVNLEITDTNGLTRSADVMVVRVFGPSTAPVARLDVLTATVEDEPVTFSAANSTPGSGINGTIIEYWWDFGDGYQAITRNPQTDITHTYADEGEYVVSVTVHTLGLATASATTTITVED